MELDVSSLIVYEVSVAPAASVDVTVSSTSPVLLVPFGQPGPTGPTGLTGPAGPTGPAGANTPVTVCEVLPQQMQNGVVSTFSVANLIDTTQAVEVFRNGLLESPGIGYGVTTGAITFSTPPLGSDVIAILYKKAQ